MKIVRNPLALTGLALRAIAIGVVFMGATLPALADEFQPIRDRSDFIALVEGRTLTQFGIRLVVEPDGDIGGRAFGRPVTGDWDWRNGYFCRSLNVGSDPLEFNCQLVERNDDVLRFTADEGDGIYADLTLR